ncbi:MAG: DNA polymerase III subunit delta [Gemmatimonadota bacterium]|nr:DNA polymerase III subunit delta [Gemmatimonadota bacterium]MDH3426921.1 DNA polymerase III subunit delta [Gemmatimonadota bacterium]
MSLSADQRLTRIIESGSLSGAFFLHGESSRLRDEAARRLADAALDPQTRDFNFDVFRGGEVTPEAIASSLAMPPVMAPRRVVLLYDAERLTPTSCSVVESVLDKLPDDITLIVTATIPDRSKKAFYRRLKEGATAMEWKSPRDAEIPGWLLERAPEKFGVAITPAAAQALAGAVGADLGLLEAELEKLAGAATDGSIGVELITALVPNVREVNRWQWIDDVADRRYTEALRQLPALLAAPGESAVGLLIALVEHHLLLGIAVEGGAGLVGRTLDRIGKPYLKFKTRTLGAQARGWTVAGIDSALRAMLEADRRAKTGASDRECLEQLLLGLEVEQRRRDCA